MNDREYYNSVEHQDAIIEQLTRIATALERLVSHHTPPVAESVSGDSSTSKYTLSALPKYRGSMGRQPVMVSDAPPGSRLLGGDWQGVVDEFGWLHFTG